MFEVFRRIVVAPVVVGLVIGLLGPTASTALAPGLNAGPARLVGQSMAAGAVAWAAAEAPDHVESLVLIGPFVRDVPPTSWLQGALMDGAVNAMLLRPWGAMAWSAYYDSLYPTAKPADMPAYRD